MKLLKRIIASSLFYPVLSMILLSLLIWYGGAYLSFADYTPLATQDSRWLLIGIMFGGYALIKLVKFLRRAWQQRKIVEEIVKIDPLDEVISSEADDLNSKFELAFDLLKTGKGKINITDLPWYIIIGSPGSGKTTLLSNSGLKFPLAKEFSNQAIKGVGGTKNCDWWFTQDAVLLDTAGRYTSQDSEQQVDSSGWTNFLGLIKKFRKKPISGLLVSFSLSDIMTMNEYEISQQISQIKRRISELNDYFSTKFPVYIIITKCDLLAGFNQFFDTLTLKEREQIFGITFNYADHQADEDVNATAGFVKAFKVQFIKLLQSLARRQWSRMSVERNANQKYLIYHFTQQLATLQPNFQHIIEQLTEPDTTNTNGIIRGIYFSSGTQSGSPFDRIITKIAQAFGLKLSTSALWNNDSRSYFIKDLLQKVIFPESDQFGVLVSYHQRQRRIKVGLQAAACTFSVLLGIGWYISYQNNAATIDTTATSVKQWVTQYQRVEQSGDIRNYLPALSFFVNNIESLKQQQQANVTGLGLGQITSLIEAVNASYNRQLQTVLMPYIKQQAQVQLSVLEQPKQSYEALKAYLMLGNVAKRDSQFLATWFEQTFTRQQTLSADQQTQLMLHTKNFLAQALTVTDLNQQVIDNARRFLGKTSLVNLYYQQFKAPYVTNPKNMLSMSELAGADWRSVFTINFDETVAMSTLFTPEVFEQVTNKLLKAYVIKLDKDQWIFEQQKQLDRKEISRKILGIYARDYITQWQTILTGTRIKRIGSELALKNVLLVAGSIDSPLLALLESAASSTMLVTESVADKLSGKVAKVFGSAKRLEQYQNKFGDESPAQFITIQFSLLHELMQEERKTLLYQRMSTVLSDLALQISLADTATDVLANKEAMESLLAFSFTQPRPLKTWLNQLSNDLSVVVRQGTKVDMAQQWTQNIFSMCSSIISNKYPFVKNARAEVSPRELALLFADSGILNQFFIANIKPLLLSAVPPLRWKTKVQQQFGFSDSVLPFFERVEKIRRQLFSTGSDSPDISLTFEPIYLDAKARKFIMNIYGTRLSYQFGRQQATLIQWPPQDPSAGSLFSFVTNDGSEISSQQHGLFALFRLFDQSKIRVINSNRMKVTFRKDQFKAIYQVTALNNSNPLVLNRLSRFRCLTGI